MSWGDPLVRTIAVIGAGFSGTITAVNLLRLSKGGLQVVLIERNSRAGRGLAYRTWNDNFVLNVPAGNMSALVEEPDDFVRYCQSIDPAFNGGSFVSRRIYGDYLEHTLQQAAGISHASLRRVQSDALFVRTGSDNRGYEIGLAGGEVLRASQVVLALGHLMPLAPLQSSGLSACSMYISNPWDATALDTIQGDAPVALIGAGHTATDVAFRLTSNNDARKIYLISRRGLALQAHRTHPQSPPHLEFPDFLANVPPTVRAYCRALRMEAAKAALVGVDWRDVVNRLRPYTPAIWHRFTQIERKRFLSKLVAYWDVHRHRLAPVAHRRLQQMLESGQAVAVAGRVQGYKENTQGLSVLVRQRGACKTKEIKVGAVVNCTGPNYDISKTSAPLIAQLRDEGMLRQDTNCLGIDVSGRYQVLDREGVAQEGLFYVGPMLKANLWEAIAVPELRVHARRLAEQLG